MGFAQVVGHGVPAGLIADMLAVTLEFFELPVDEKVRLLPPGPAVNRGYAPVRQRGARPERMRAVYVAYFDALARLAGTLMSAFAQALDLPEDYFAGRTGRAPNVMQATDRLAT
ncbi:2-oxoglutarate and iron-dependent oxygenase domain-containing protein [Frankia sp. QA3]|uniref:2-oxoglutarate and iron-dependent oxygenase domain-containing protein n=1 Tax=Frankia sp. QA3 TaxID=710111 RepID=UPI000318662E|nr:2-oxoglutarate and iron-dependent oxygenase domain-containing protein [Frankia sp. QA3]